MNPNLLFWSPKPFSNLFYVFGPEKALNKKRRSDDVWVSSRPTLFPKPLGRPETNDVRNYPRNGSVSGRPKPFPFRTSF
jgi:hypothetical protein